MSKCEKCVNLTKELVLARKVIKAARKLPTWDPKEEMQMWQAIKAYDHRQGRPS